jgi:hypothetical protein
MDQLFVMILVSQLMFVVDSSYDRLFDKSLVHMGVLLTGLVIGLLIAETIESQRVDTLWNLRYTFRISYARASGYIMICLFGCYCARIMIDNPPRIKLRTMAEIFKRLKVWLFLAGLATGALTAFIQSVDYSD